MMAKKKKRLKMVELSSLKPNPNNPRFISERDLKTLKRSITEFKKMMALRPIIVDEDGYILGGNQRHKALEELGYTEIPDEWVMRAEDLTEAEKKEFIIKDNVSAGEWDIEGLKEAYSDVPLDDFGLSVGFKEDDLFDVDGEFEGGEDAEDEAGENKPSLTDDKHSQFSIVLKYKDKKELNDILKAVKEAEGFEMLSDTLLHIVREYERKH